MNYIYLLAVVVFWIALFRLLVNSQKIREGLFEYVSMFAMLFAAYFSAKFMHEQYGLNYDLSLLIFIAIPMLYLVWSIFQAYRHHNRQQTTE